MGNRLPIKKKIGVRAIILLGNETGAIVFKERHTKVSNKFSLLNLEIGRGFTDSGSLQEID